MWWKEYADHRYDEPLKKQRVETGKGIVGCEMNDRHGYGTTLHRSQYRIKRGLITGFFAWLFGVKEENDG
jgi:hypothetical protein